MRVATLVLLLALLPAWAAAKEKPDCVRWAQETEIESACGVKVQARGEPIRVSASRCVQTYDVSKAKRNSTSVAVTIAWGAHLESQEPADFLATEEDLPGVEAFQMLDGLGDAATRHELVASFAGGQVREQTVRFIRGRWFVMLQSYGVSDEPPCTMQELVELGALVDQHLTKKP